MEKMKHFVDGLSAGGVVATIMGWLPAVAAVLSIAWTAIRIYETKTVQDFLARRKAARKQA